VTDIAELMFVVDSRPAEAGAKRTQTALEDVGRAASNLGRTLIGSFGSGGGAASASKTIDSIGRSASAASPALANLRQQILGLAGGLSAARVASDFLRQTAALDANLQRIARIQGLETTAAGIERINSALKATGSGFFSRVDASAAAEQASAANFSLADSLKVVADSEDLARESGLTLAQATNAVAASTKALGGSSQDAAKVANILGKVGDLSAENITAYVGVIQKVAPEARKAGIGIAEFGAALNVLDDEGQNATTTGRDLAGIFNAMVSPTKEAVATLKDYGLTLDDIDVHGHSFAEILQRLQRAQLDAAAAGRIFGDGNSATALALIRNAGAVGDLAEEFERFIKVATSKDARDASEAIKAIQNAYEDLLLSLRDAGGEQVVVGALGVAREIIDDLSGKDRDMTLLARSIELVGGGLVTAFVARPIVAGIAATTRGILALRAAAATNPISALVVGASLAIPTLSELVRKLDELRNGESGGRNRDVAGFLAPFSAIQRTAFIADSPAASLSANSKAQLAQIEKLGEAALKSGNIISQRAGVAASKASREFAEQVLETLKALSEDGSAAARKAANDIVEAFAKPLLEGSGDETLIKRLGVFDEDTARRFKKIIAEIEVAGNNASDAVNGAAPNIEALNAATAAQSRILDAIEATTRAAEKEREQIEALNAAFEAESALAFERSLVGLDQQVQSDFARIEEFRQTLLKAGLSASDVGARTQAFATNLYQLAEGARAAEGAISELEGESEGLRIAQEAAQEAAKRESDAITQAVRSADEAVTRLRKDLRLEAETLGLSAAEAARYRKEVEFATQANIAFGEGSDAARTAIGEYNAELARADAQREAIEASRDFAEALVNPVGSALDDTVERLIKGHAATINFRDALLDLASEIGKGVFHNLVTKPATDAATTGLAGAFGGLFGADAPTAPAAPPTSNPSPADVLGQAGAGAAATVGGVFSAQQAGVVNIQAAVVNLAQGLVPGLPAAGGANLGASAQSLAGLASAFGGGNAPTNVPNSSTGGGSALLGVNQLAATAPSVPSGSTAVDAQASVQPTSQPVPERAALGTAATGAASGAQVGTAIAPGLGTAIGFVAGALLGYIAGGALNSSRGNVFRHGRLVPHANGGIVDQFAAFPLAGGRIGTLGEDGPEAILPLRRGRGGRLGVEVSGGGGRGGDVVQVSVTQNIRTPDTVGFRRQASSLAVEQRRVQKRQQSRRT